MKKRLKLSKKVRLLDIWPYLQFLITLVVTISLFIWEKNQNQGYIVTLVFAFVGIYSSIQTFILKNIFEDKLHPLNVLKDILDLNIDVHKIRDLYDLYLKINNTFLQDIKEGIIEETINRLKDIVNRKTLVLTKSEFYDYIFQFFELDFIDYKRVWAVSMLRDPEWKNDDPYENRFLEENFKITEENVVLERIFIIPDSLQNEIFNNRAHPITQHFLLCPACLKVGSADSSKSTKRNCKSCKEKEKSLIRPYLVSVDFIRQYQPDILKKCFGFIAFDEEIVFIDGDDMNNEEEYSKLSVSSDDIKKAQDLFSALKRYQVETCQVCDS